MKFLPVRHLLSALLLVLVTTTLLAPRAHAQAQDVLDEIVAVVGKDIILRSEVDAYVQALVQQQQVPYSEALWMEALNQLIDQKVMAVHAERDTTLAVTDDQVEQALDQRISQLSAQMGGQAQVEETYGKSLLQIKADFREEFREQLLADQLRSRKLQGIRITPSEVGAWFQRIPADSLPTLPDLVRIAHIVRYPEVTEQARRDAREIITAIRDSIIAGGATIEELARQFSEDPGSAQGGGRYPDSRLGELAPEFAAVAARIPEGEISQVFETPFGLHILRVNERRGNVVDFNHILIGFDESKNDPTEAIATLESVRDSILTHKAPFELMARRHSEEQMSAVRGGRVVDPATGTRDLPLQALDYTWRGTINELDEGEISEPTEVALLDGTRAYHILKLQRRIPAHRVSLATDYERIEQIALQEKQARILREWLDALRKDVYLEMRGKAEDLAAATE